MAAGTLPVPDYADIQAADTRLTWLQRTEPNHTWTAHPNTGQPVGTANPDDPLSDGFVYISITEADFEAAKQALRGHPPIWPGIAAVTLGVTVPCVESTVLELPMDGLLILITSYPPTRARWGAAPYYSVYHTGRLAFISDNGDVEEFQYMGWTSAVYTPRSMKRAGGVVIFLEPNVEAAATPWDVTS